MRGGFSGWLREVEVARILFSGLGSIAWGAGGRRGGLALGPSQGLRDEFPGTCRSSVASVIPSHVCQTRAPVAALSPVALGVRPLKSRACRHPPSSKASLFSGSSPVESLSKPAFAVLHPRPAESSREQAQRRERGLGGQVRRDLGSRRSYNDCPAPAHCDTTIPPPHNRPVVSFQGV